VTFLFTDIERSTDLVRRLGADFGRVRGEHHRILREAFERHGGHEIDTAGDGFFVAFERAGDAVAAAVAAQRSLAGANGGAAAAVRVRMGLHTAEPYHDEGGYTGIGVHRAARICAAGHGGQIVASNATAGIVEDLGLEGVTLLDLGEHRLKDMERPQRLFQLTIDGLPSEFPPLASLDAAAGSAIRTLMVVDVTGWQRVLTTYGDERAATIARGYHRIVADEVRANGGRELELVADTVLSVFEHGADALRAALRVRHALRTLSWFPAADPPDVRIAIHSGRIADVASRSLGTVAYRCFSLGNTAEPGQILVSHATEALLEGEPLDVELRNLGERAVARFAPASVFELVERGPG
jgi:class 3 adenylate cyclase